MGCYHSWLRLSPLHFRNIRSVTQEHGIDNRHVHHCCGFRLLPVRTCCLSQSCSLPKDSGPTVNQLSLSLPSIWQDYLRSVDAEGLCHDEHAQPVVEPSEAHPREADTLGWVVKVWCPADGQYHQGQLISFRAETGRHHVLYEDGEDEWLELSQERLKWLHHLAKPLHAGLLEGEV